MARILIDCRFWGPKHTGLGRYAENLVENLLKLDKKNNFYLLLQKKDRVEIKQNSKTVTSINIDLPHYSLKEQLFLSRIIIKLEPDLVHFLHFNLPFSYKGRFVVTIHDLIKHESKGAASSTRTPWVYNVKYLGYKFIFAQAVKKAHHIIVPSQQIKKQLDLVYPGAGKKTEVTYEGVGEVFSGLKPDQGKTDKLLLKYKLRKPFLIYTGNVYPHKNLSKLIFAIKKLSRETKINLVIVCSRDVFCQRLQKEVKDLKAEELIFMPGFIPDNDLVGLYQQALGFITPSLMEGFGLPGLEAMRAGCPVLASNIPIFKEVYGQEAVFFNPQKIESMQEAILKLIRLSPLKRQALIQKARQQALKYSWQECASKTLKIYENSLSL